MVNFDGLEDQEFYEPNHVVAEGEGVLDLNSHLLEPLEPFGERQETEAPFYQDDYKALTNGITEIDCTKDYPSKLYAFGKDSFSVTMDKYQGSAGIVAARHGKVSF